MMDTSFKRESAYCLVRLFNSKCKNYVIAKSRSAHNLLINKTSSELARKSKLWVAKEHIQREDFTKLIFQ
jgi:hypothetical protein